MFEVSFPSKKRPGTICTERYDTLEEAAEVCMAQYAAGKHPHLTVRHPVFGDFNAGPMCANKWSARPIVQWWISFAADGIYKSIACRTGENCGVHYASHRAGYRASRRAFAAFAKALDAKIERIQLSAAA